MKLSLKTISSVHLLIAFCFLSAAAVRCSTIEDYASRLDAARTQTERLISDIDDGTFTEPDMRDAINRIRRNIPASEKVEINGTAVETSNGWLGAELSSLEKESSDTGRKQILSNISDRLAAIESRVSELESASSAATTKDQDKQKLNEILSRPEYQKPEEKDESLFQRFVNWLLDLISRLFPSPQMSPVNPLGFQSLSLVIQVLVYGAIIGLLALLVYKFAPALVARFSVSRKKGKASRIVLGEYIDASVSASDLFSEAEQLARQGDIKSAIRKGYIALICDLGDKKVLRLGRYKTNRDYLKDLSLRTSLIPHVRSATSSFERFWYGPYSPIGTDWEEFKDRYHSAIREV